MAKTLKQLDNGLRVKYLVKPKKHFLFWGSMNIRVDGQYHNGFKTQEAAEEFGNLLKGSEKDRKTK